MSERFAKLYDLPYLRVESSDASILHALDTAQQLYVTQQENARQQEQLQIQLERYQNILDYTHDAIIAIDENGRISTTNQIAEQMLRPAHPPFAGRPIEEVLPNTHLTSVLQTGEAEIGQMMNIHGTLVSTNRVPIRVGGQVKGVVATFQDIKTLQTAERNIRIKLHEKGLVAKYRFSDILGQSPAILEAKRLSENFADSQFTVMLYGETGTGKEMFAQSIHNASPRRDGPFVAINCTALNRNLLESELFGYTKGAFTGALNTGKEGLIEAADKGTLFLDEVGELSLNMQAKLLHVLQNRSFIRVGDNEPIQVDIRVIAATNCDLEEMVQQKRFREDLYYRLNVMPIHIPPLRKRKNDIIPLAQHFLDYYNQKYDFHRKLSPATCFALLNYRWEGNVRQLKNSIEQATIITDTDLIQPESLPMNVAGPEPVQDAPAEAGLNEMLERMELRYLQTFYERYGSIRKAAERLKLPPTTFLRHWEQLRQKYGTSSAEGKE